MDDLSFLEEIKLFDLKIDPERDHHYIFSVAVEDAYQSKFEVPKFYLKHGPVHFTNKDVLNLKKAIIIMKDKLFKTKERDALKMHECDELVHTLTMLLYSAKANNATIHHISGDIEIEDKTLAIIVSMANSDEKMRKILKDSKI